MTRNRFIVLIFLGLGLIIITTAILYRQNKLPWLKQTNPIPDISSPAPKVSVFMGTVKEIKGQVISVERSDDKKLVSVSLDQNTQIFAWKYAEATAPAQQSANMTDIRIGQKIEISLSEIGKKTSVFKLVIF